MMNGTKMLRGILRQTRPQRRASTIILVIIAALGIGPAFALSPVDPVTGATLWTPPTEAGELRPGLAVSHSYGGHGYVDDIEVLRNPVIGKPLENIAHRIIDGKLTSTQAMLVAAHIRGLIQFEAAGAYVFRIESNNHVKAKIGGR